jgi:signal transduction histidine kinase
VRNTRPAFRYRFTFFQRQFLSHMIIAVLILSLVGIGLTYNFKQNSYVQKKNELNSASNGIVKSLQKEDNPAASLLFLRTFLREQNIAFVLMNPSGEVEYKDVAAVSSPLKNKSFIDSLHNKIYGLKGVQSFVVDENTKKPYVVTARSIRTKAPKESLYLFVYSLLPGLSQGGKQIDQTILYTLIAAFFLAIVVSWLISRNLSRSVNMLRQATKEIALGNFSTRSHGGRSDELGDLSQDFNRMAERLEAASLKLEQFEQRRVSFLVDVSHELRTPLTSIRGIIEGFKNQLITDSEEQRKYFAIIEKETFRLIRLINELLDLEKIQNGQFTLKSEAYNALELLEVIAESLEVLIEEKNLQIQISCPSDIEIYGDYDRLTQIGINLIKNSIQFTEYGTIRITASMNETDTTIEITDTGRGMSKQELEFIWDRFYKSDPSRAKEKSETGLGLSIVKQLVTAHHGSIEVQSELGIGTTFRLKFPRKR